VSHTLQYAGHALITPAVEIFSMNNIQRQIRAAINNGLKITFFYIKVSNLEK
jgi:hypothetical protein